MLHDIGKAVDHDVEGVHAIIGGELLRVLGVDPGIVHAVKAHHFDEEPSTDLAMLTICADAISASRPGARRDTLATYLLRLEQLQTIATRHGGVDRAFPLQAGRELRVFVKASQVKDTDMPPLTSEIAREIESEMQYPGVIKVTVIRETTATATAPPATGPGACCERRARQRQRQRTSRTATAMRTATGVRIRCAGELLSRRGRLRSTRSEQHSRRRGGARSRREPFRQGARGRTGGRIRRTGRSCAPGIRRARMRAFSNGMTTSSVPCMTSAGTVTDARCANESSGCHIALNCAENTRRPHRVGRALADLRVDELRMRALELRRVEDACRRCRYASSGVPAPLPRSLAWSSGRGSTPASPPGEVAARTRSQPAPGDRRPRAAPPARPSTRRTPPRPQHPTASSTATTSAAIAVSVVLPVPSDFADPARVEGDHAVRPRQVGNDRRRTPSGRRRVPG